MASEDTQSSTLVMNQAETSAISIMRDLPAGQRADALKWFEKIAKNRGIRKEIIGVLESYVANPKKR